MTKSGTLFSSNRMQKCNTPSSRVKSPCGKFYIAVVSVGVKNVCHRSIFNNNNNNNNNNIY